MSEIHKEEEWDAFCLNCERPLCLDCLIEHSENHKDHKVLSFLEMTTMLVKEIEQRKPMAGSMDALQQELNGYIMNISQKIDKSKFTIKNIVEFTASLTEKILTKQVSALLGLKEECEAVKSEIQSKSKLSSEAAEKIANVKAFYKRKEFKQLIVAYKEENSPKKDQAEIDQKITDKQSLFKKIEYAVVSDPDKIRSIIEQALNDAFEKIQIVQIGCSQCKKPNIDFAKNEECYKCGSLICQNCVNSCKLCGAKMCKKCMIKCQGDCNLNVCSKCMMSKRCGKCAKTKCKACWIEKCEICKTIRKECCLKCKQCQKSICNECKKVCEKCGEVCKNEVKKCEKCNIIYCTGCKCNCYKEKLLWYNGARNLKSSENKHWNKFLSNIYIDGPLIIKLHVKDFVQTDNDYKVIVGLEKYTNGNKNLLNDDGLAKTGTAYGISFNHYKFFLNFAYKYESYGAKINSGDEIKIIYDKSKNISFEVNDNSYGIAYSNCEGPFYLFCYSYAQVELEIVSCDSI